MSGADRLPVGVLIPVRNSRKDLPAHVDFLSSWLPKVQEVVVVDSESTDGTVEYLRQHLNHPDVRFLQHPPGLYQSWGHGISHVSAEYLTIATVGDGLYPGGLETLLEVASRYSADVVVSPPEFVADEDRGSEHVWPIHEMIGACGLVEPRVLSTRELLAWAMMRIPQTLLGSSASNLYRTECFRSRPFPVDFGHAGDSAWAIRSALELRWAVVPTTISRFWLHQASPDIQRVYSKVAPRMLQLFSEVLREACKLGGGDPALGEMCKIYLEIARVTESQVEDKAIYRRLRDGGGIRALMPERWRLKCKLKLDKLKLERCRTRMREILAEI